MTALTSTKGEGNLPRYFSRVFAMAQRMERGQLDFHLPDGRVFRAQGQASGIVAQIHLHDPDVFARLIREGDLGFCEAYLDGGWSTPDLMAFMDLLHDRNDTLYDAFPGMAMVRLYERVRFFMQRNSKKQARKNIAAHYDLGNDFYGLWLDESMTYSAALFEDGAQSLTAAQRAKYASMVDLMGVNPGDHVLEIGCGWGGFAEYAAAERGLKVTALTISQEQYDFACARIEAAGLQDKVQILMRDYRDETGLYDGIASIEMFEAVGERYWPVYFDTVHARLRPGARAVLQIITVEDRRWNTYRKGVDFIQKYIFPGGMLPCPKVLRDQAGRAGLRVEGSKEFAEGYSQTLRLWHGAFNGAWGQVSALGFDDRFRRMWNFYLCSCAGAFRGGICDVTQITLSRP